MGLQKEQQIEKQKIKWNQPENAVEAVKPFFGTQIMFDCSFIEDQSCSMRPLIDNVGNK